MGLVISQKTREEHRTNPPTHWFLAETCYGRLLKVVFVPDTNGKDIYIKTAYEPNEQKYVYTEDTALVYRNKADRRFT